MTPEGMDQVLKAHTLYLRGDTAGKRANLYGANLYGANLYGARFLAACGFD